MPQNRRPDQKLRIRRKATQLFAKNGYTATGIQELSEAVGLGRGALYHHIGSKEQLLFDIITVNVVRVVGQAEELAAKPLPAEEKVRRLSRIMMATLVDDVASWTVFFQEVDVLTGDLRREFLAWRHRFEAVWLTVIAQGVRDGEFRTLDPLAVKGILGMHNYAPVWLRPRGEKTSDEIAEIFCDLLLPGLRVQAPAP